MSRSNIPSLQELLAQRKRQSSGVRNDTTPKFLTKKERSSTTSTSQMPENNTPVKPVITAPVKKRTLELDEPEQKKRNIAQETIDANYAKVLSRAQGSRGIKKFKFTWTEEDDTTSLNDDEDSLPEYQPSFLSKKSNSSAADPLLREKPDIHWSQKSLSQMNTRDWRIFKEDYGLSIKLPPGQVSKIYPLRNWGEMSTNANLKSGVKQLGFEEPTPVQRVSIPYGCENFDLISVAETGSGKTLGFLIPLLEKLHQLPRLNEFSKSNGPYSIILVPTRELAQQIEMELSRLLQIMRFGIDIVSIVGGKVISEDIRRLNGDRVEVVIATPGRLIDCLERHYLVLNQVECLILDECDKMIEMRFKEQILKIKQFIPQNVQRNCQGLMFTATLGAEIEKVLREFVHSERCVTLQVGDVMKTELTVNDRIEQRFEFFPASSDEKEIERKKQRKLVSLLRSPSFNPPVIIFINYKETGETLLVHLQSLKFKVAILHGSKSQAQREAALEQLKSHKVDILIATNVASRGIDIPDVSLVVNYQMSQNVEDYVHRVGRTGRAGNYGTAVTFLEMEKDQPVFKGLKKVVERNGGKVPREFRDL
ncbi:hypothetical protein WICPIJ_002770 [Wickerhamomyces pijperi]|uniref:RNA helicase n=1 Tax=Wickerhamomyces pijperi TaxID=599730 RepID=A0A9P8Q8K1_WICPI|nr:hypothetical protein WICPIJ_002770 [Wickerhamomyces pijperi]